MPVMGGGIVTHHASQVSHRDGTAVCLVATPGVPMPEAVEERRARQMNSALIYLLNAASKAAAVVAWEAHR